MAFGTSVVTLSETWVEIGSGMSQIIAQVSSVYPAAIHVGDSLPSAGAPHIVLNTDYDRSIALDSLTTEKVYARAVSGVSKITVIKD